MKLSIIIPVYNSEKYIRRCLDSLLCQNIEYKHYEIFIINDGSTDNSLDIALAYEKKYPQIKVFSQLNSGVGSARNKGIELSTGSYLYFIDPDDYLVHNVLNKLLDYAFNFNLEILSFNSKSIKNINVVTTKNTLKRNTKLQKQTGIAYIGDRFYKNEVWWYIINRKFLKNTGIKFIVGRWMEDAIFTAQLFLKTKAIAHTEIDVHLHVITRGSAMTSKEPGHYLNVIRDNANAAIIYKSLINQAELAEPYNDLCVNRLKTRQQSFVFFMMIRMLKSTIKYKEVKSIIDGMTVAGAYPLSSFLGKDYNGKIYYILVKLFNNRYVYYILFLIFNPLLKKVILFKKK
ncbi:MAG: glycosyltransferase [Flaviramulus sp.]|nr:glycosyltransferase [Flaviramulus sp.]NNC49533.1 glycosyltransferase [Flaviramulus sp.]